MHKVFISYHHDNDQCYKEKLLRINDQHKVFIDASVHAEDIDESLDDQQIREKIRDEYLKDSTVTILLAGTETKKRKHVDWELYSSMHDGKVNKKSGILVINLPCTHCTGIVAAHGDEEERLYSEEENWTGLSRKQYERVYHFLPDRIIDNLIIYPKAKISVTNWDKIACFYAYPNVLESLIKFTFNDRKDCEYDMARPMKRNNS